MTLLLDIQGLTIELPPGGASGWPSRAQGSCGAIQGANKATSAINNSMPAPLHARQFKYRFCAMRSASDTRVDDPQREVGNKVRQHDHD